MKTVLLGFLLISGALFFTVVQAQDPFGGAREPVQYSAGRVDVVPVGLVMVSVLLRPLGTPMSPAYFRSSSLVNFSSASRLAGIVNHRVLIIFPVDPPRRTTAVACGYRRKL